MKRNTITYKLFLNFVVLHILIIVILVSCSKKDNSLVKETKAASTITNGIASVGPAGPHNNLVYYGTTDPDPSVGCLGDYYLDVDKGILYGPKVVNGWGAFLTLNGATAAENKIFCGPNLPELSLGTTGDYYVNTNDFLFYGPRTSAGWGNPVDLQHRGK